MFCYVFYRLVFLFGFYHLRFISASNDRAPDTCLINYLLYLLI